MSDDRPEKTCPRCGYQKADGICTKCGNLPTPTGNAPEVIQREVAPGLKVQRGKDGHWIIAEHKRDGKYGMINVENVIKSPIARRAFVSALDDFLEMSTPTPPEKTVHRDPDPTKLDPVGDAMNPTPTGSETAEEIQRYEMASTGLPLHSQKGMWVTYEDHRRALAARPTVNSETAEEIVAADRVYYPQRYPYDEQHVLVLIRRALAAGEEERNDLKRQIAKCGTKCVEYMLDRDRLREALRIVQADLLIGGIDVERTVELIDAALAEGEK